MDTEMQKIEYKSLQKIRTGDKGFNELAVTCVAFANAQGGVIYVGYDYKSKKPIEGQTISIKELNDTLSRLRSKCFNT
ncbi:MAG: ATP-binding protein [Bacteroidales bacterium]|jgi:ATP-dependent DNA helicase RecG|nr:ATP-binding protein [Bacteroidales bacterium]MCI2121079.1 ATP-binding protein [Bacteroidales bacterium]MCI2144894.1 ATP-binding protein [Bacteroidales bacterium]